MEKKQPLISIIMSAYNEAAYIGEAIDSIIKQPYDNFEFIIIDDASIDDTVSIIKKYNDDRIRLIQNSENKRLAFNLNLAIENANGKYIARMDADDICMPTRFEKQVEFLETHPDVSIVGGSAQEFGDANALLSYPKDHEAIKVMMLFENAMCHPAVMFRNNSKIFHYDSDFKASQDYELWSRIIWDVQFANISDIVLKYRIHKKQTKHLLGNEQKAGAVQARKNLLTKLLGKPTEDILEIFLDACNYHFPKSEKRLIEIQDLFSSLLQINKTKQLFDSKILEDRIQNQFIQDCYVSVRNGTASFNVLKNSRFYKSYSEKSFKFHIKMFLARVVPKRRRR